jgi:hypothetical protein
VKAEIARDAADYVPEDLQQLVQSDFVRSTGRAHVGKFAQERR